MIRSMYTATSGMLTKGYEQFDSLANNIANAHTPGFRAQYIHQASLPNQSAGGSTDIQVRTLETYEDTRQGQSVFTGESNDLAIDGEGYLCVRLPTGETGYTRNGKLSRDAKGTLKDHNGYEVQGNAGPISIPPNGQMKISEDGTVSVDGKRLDQLKVVSFDKGELNQAGSSLYFPKYGAKEKPSTAGIIQGYYERSNVSVVEEMVKMVEMLRSFESFQKALVTASEDTTARVIRETGMVR